MSGLHQVRSTKLRDLQGKSKSFASENFNKLFHGLPEFFFGWKWLVDQKTNLKYAYHEGSPGSFLTKVLGCKETDRAYIVFANLQSDETDDDLDVLVEQMKRSTFFR